MPHSIITRKISLSRWYKPTTWGKFRVEWKYSWNMDRMLWPNEIKAFVEDQAKGNPWHQTKLEFPGAEEKVAIE